MFQIEVENYVANIDEFCVMVHQKGAAIICLGAGYEPLASRKAQLVAQKEYTG